LPHGPAQAVSFDSANHDFPTARLEAADEMSVFRLVTFANDQSHGGYLLLLMNRVSLKECSDLFWFVGEWLKEDLVRGRNRIGRTPHK
jgi:hypothetical protein